MVPDRFYFNPRSHEGSDFVLFPYFVQSLRFQSTLPRGERRYLPLEDSSYRKFQSTLPRGERRLWQQEQTLPLPFQSTLPRGERRLSALRSSVRVDFNPRSHEGSDHSTPPSICSHKISIHAPTRGATLCTYLCSSVLYFNPRSHEGSDPSARIHPGVFRNFNPRSHEGSDANDRGNAPSFSISIHAPTRGATNLP